MRRDSPTSVGGRPCVHGQLTAGEISWTAIHYLLLAAPIIVTILITAASRFKQGNKWLLLRAGAEAIKREIFRFRAGALSYAPPADTCALDSSSARIARYNSFTSTANCRAGTGAKS